MRRAFLFFCLFWTVLAKQDGIAALILFDDFDNGNPTTGATIHPNQWYAPGTASEQNSKLTVSTPANSAQWSSALYSTAVSPALNFFENPITISVRDFSMSGIGANESAGQNFRIGLLARNSPTAKENGKIAFYDGGDDGVALTISNGKTFNLRYKNDSPSNTDPNIVPTALSGKTSETFATGITIEGFDFTISNLFWSLDFYLSDGSTSHNSGNWNSTSGSTLENSYLTWGNEVDGWGSSALVMYAQNGSVGNGSVSFSMGSIMVTPEPSRMITTLGGMLLLLSWRRR